MLRCLCLVPMKVDMPMDNTKKYQPYCEI
jgi:hypothetical protein